MGGNGGMMEGMKRIVLNVSLCYIAYFALLFFTTYFCSSSWCDFQEDGLFGVILYLFLPLAPVFLLSLITWKMREEVFTAWWNFARWWIPVIIATTIFANTSLQNRHGYLGDLGFGLMVISIPYVILVVGSLYRIIKTY